MLGLNEAKSSVIYFSLLTYQRMKGAPRPEFVPGATLEAARAADQRDGNFDLSRNIYYSVGVQAVLPSEKAQALVGEMQQDINLGLLVEAIDLSRCQSAEVGCVLGQERFNFLAAVASKQGWALENLKNFRGAINRFSHSNRFLNQVALADRDKGWREVFSTNCHFIGRSAYALEDRPTALTGFVQGLILDRQGYERGDWDQEKQGFGYAWISRVMRKIANQPANSSVEGRHNAARPAVVVAIARAIEHLGQFQASHPNRGIGAHVYMLLADQLLRDVAKTSMNRPAALEAAETYFKMAERTRLVVEPYPLGLADALLGQARVAAEKQEWVKMVSKINQAIKVFPPAVFKGVIGL